MRQTLDKYLSNEWTRLFYPSTPSFILFASPLPPLSTSRPQLCGLFEIKIPKLFFISRNNHSWVCWHGILTGGWQQPVPSEPCQGAAHRLLRITQCPRILPVLLQAGAGGQLVCISVESNGIPLYYSGADAPPALPLLPLWAAIEQESLHLTVLKEPGRGLARGKLQSGWSLPSGSFHLTSGSSITLSVGYRSESSPPPPPPRSQYSKATGISQDIPSILAFTRTAKAWVRSWPSLFWSFTYSYIHSFLHRITKY